MNQFAARWPGFFFAAGALIGYLFPDPHLTAAGLPLVARHFGTLLLAIGWLGACAGFGRLLVRRLGPAGELGVAAELGLGIAGMGVVGLLLGALGLLYPAPLLIAALVAALLIPAPPPPAPGTLGQLPGPIAAAGGAVVLVLVLAGLGPIVDWDALTYHLRVPAGFLANHAMAVPADNLHAAFVGTLHFASLPLLAAGLPTGVTLFLLGASGIALAALPALLPEQYRVAGGGWAILLVLAAPLFVVVAATPRLDSALLIFLLPAHALLLGPGRKGDRVALVVAGVLIGAGGGAKLQALVYGTGIVLTWILLALLERRPRSETIRALGTLALGALVAWLPWALREWLQFGSPLYPFATPFRLEPWLRPLLGAAGPLDLSFTKVLGESRSIFSPWLMITDPARLMLEFDAKFLKWSVLFILAPVGIWMLRRGALALFLPPIFYLAVLLGVSPTTNLRYFILLLPPLAVAATVPAVAFLRGREARTRLAAALLWAGLALVPMIPWTRFTFAGPLPAYLAGTGTERETRREWPVPHVAALQRAVEAVDTLTPPDAKILFLFESRGWWFDRQVTIDARLGNWPLLAQTPGGPACRAVAGFTHVVLNVSSMNYYVQRGASREAMHLSSLGPFIQRCLTPVWSGAGFFLFAVRAPA